MDSSKRFPVLKYYVSFLTLALVLCCCAPAQGVAVMSLDFGSEWMKVAIVSPGVPMEIALNKESKRKTPVVVAFRNGERTFGEDAMAVCVRFPQNCYLYLLDLLGKKVDNPLVNLYQERFPQYKIIPDPERGTVVFQHDDDTTFSIEELVAMIISKAHEMAVLSANQQITEAVITVPGYFNQAERRALIQSAELAGLKVLQLINDYTAVALNYGIFRSKDFNETAQYIMLYDMGASSTSASVISYQVVKSRDKGVVETNPQLSVLGVGYDRTLGGLEMQLRLRDFLAFKFNELKKTKNDVTKNARSMAKLFKEAGRLKNVLSANADHFAQVEGLIDEIDFKVQVTREDFEKLCADLFEKVSGPVQMALKSSGLTMDVIGQVILVGAGTRVPAVQEKLMLAVGIDLSKNLNTDEAAVFGAVYKAADLSAGFKVKKFLTKDCVLFPIQVTFEREVEGSVRLMKRTLFGFMNSYPQKKILTFNKNLTDFDFNVGYGDVDYLPPNEIAALGSLNISKVFLSGVAEVLSKNQGPNVESKGIKAHFQMDDSGLLRLANIEHVAEKTIVSNAEPEESPLSKLGSTISKLFSGPEETLKNENLEKSDEGEDNKEDKKEDYSGETNKTRNGTDKDEKKTADDKPKILTFKEAISSQEELLIVPSLGSKQLEAAQAKIDLYNLNDEKKRRHEGALNALESFVFEARNKLESDEYKSAATDEEASAVSKSCLEMADWLDEEGFTADVDTLESKLKELKKLTNDVWSRVKEHQERPEALAALHSVINGSQHFLKTIQNLSQNAESKEHSMFTEVEITSLEKAIKETEDWKEKAVAEQNQQPLNQSPKLTVKLIVEKMAYIDREVKYLMNKAKIWRPPVPPVSENGTKEKTVDDTQTNKTGESANLNLSEGERGPEIESNEQSVNGTSAKSEKGSQQSDGVDDAIKFTEHSEL